MLNSLRRHVDLRAYVIAALTAGTIFVIFWLILAPLALRTDGTLYLRYAASMVLGETALLDGSLGVLALGLVIHFVLCFAFTALVVFLVYRWGLVVGIIGGGLIGLCLYFINFYAATLLFPWFFAWNSNVLLAAHVLFGAAAGGLYEALDRFDLPFPQTQESAR